MQLKKEFLIINNSNNIIEVCQKTQKSVKHNTGFGYETKDDIIKDLFDEIQELQDELIVSNNKEKIRNELGDVVFVLCNLANKYDINLEDALNHSTLEFQRRLVYIENKLKKEINNQDILKFWKESKEFKLL